MYTLKFTVTIYIIYVLIGFTSSITNWRKYHSRKTAGNVNFVQRKYILLNNTPCFCIPIKVCPAMLSLLSIHPIHPETIEFLKNQTCGFEGVEPYVCCYKNNDSNAPTPPLLPHPRLQRCMVSSEEETSTDNNVKEIPNRFGFHSAEHFHFQNHPKYPRGHFHRGWHEYHPYPDRTSSHENFPNEITEVDTSTTTTETTSRSQLLPDDICGLSLDQRIVGGRNVKLGAFPWIARLGYTRPQISVYLYRCGGTLITSRYVLTAAHCVTGLPDGLTLATIRLGEQDERSDPDCDGDECADSPQDFTPDVVIAHSNYNIPKYKHDIALIGLNREATITAYVSPICLPLNFMKSFNYTGLEATAAGWGVVNMTLAASSPTLQEITLQISNTDMCKSMYRSAFELDISEEQLCTVGQTDKDTCEGDSGGPLMRMEQTERNGVPRYYMLGIVSFGPRRCGTADVPGVFTRVSNYIDWILDHINSMT